MSLIAKIHHPSPISDWFGKRQNDTIDKLVEQANIFPPGCRHIDVYSTNTGLVKAATVYGIIKHLAYLNNRPNWLDNTHASTYIQNAKLDGIFESWIGDDTSMTREAVECIIAAALDISYRIGKEHEFIKPFIRAVRNGSKVQTTKKWGGQWVSTINEVKELIGYIARCHHWEPDNRRIIPNPTFKLSNSIGGAQADLIVGNTVVSAIAHQTFTHHDFHELIAYVLLDAENIYGIDRLTWVLPRRQTSLTVTTSELFRNLQQSRKEFQKMVEENYPPDEFNCTGDGMDLSKYNVKYC
jgi:hypothetical protein